MNRAMQILLTAIAAVSASSSMSPALAQGVVPSDEVLKWNQITVDAVRRDNTPPPLASHNMAIVHGAVYDAVNSIFQTHAVYRVPIQPPRHASPSAAAAAAAHRVLVQIYPAQKEHFDAALRESLAHTRDGRAQHEGVQLGSFVADRFLDWRRPDASRTRDDSSASAGSGLWLPTPPQFQKPALPQWGRVTPFAVRDTKQFRSDPPPKLSSAEYARCFEETKALGAIDSKVRTEDQTEIAYFWADGPKTCTPPGHWNEIARTVAIDQGNTLAENARLFALLNISMADAAICCWECKFMYGFWRPITAIRNAADDDNPATPADPDWTPLLETPPFPAYTSGHSSFSGAAAAVLADFFGTNYIRFTAVSDALPGVERSFSSFSEAAEEAGLSRIYGGIHWACDNVEGLAMGRSVGADVCRRLLLDQRTVQRTTKQDAVTDSLLSRTTLIRR